MFEATTIPTASSQVGILRCVGRFSCASLRSESDRAEPEVSGSASPTSDSPSPLSEDSLVSLSDDSPRREPRRPRRRRRRRCRPSSLSGEASSSSVRGRSSSDAAIASSASDGSVGSNSTAASICSMSPAKSSGGALSSCSASERRPEERRRRRLPDGSRGRSRDGSVAGSVVPVEVIAMPISVTSLSNTSCSAGSRCSVVDSATSGVGSAGGSGVSSSAGGAASSVSMPSVSARSPQPDSCCGFMADFDFTTSNAGGESGAAGVSCSGVFSG